MKMRFARSGSIAIAAGLVLVGGTALAAGSSPAALKWKEDKTTFPSTATRFDGALYKGKVYFLGFRVDDAGTTDGTVWSYDPKTDKYTNTKTTMPVPISNYQIAVLKDKNGTGLYTFGGRDANGKILKDVQVYYPDTNKAVELNKKDFWPGTTPSKCVSLPGTGVTTIGNTAYVVGGMSFSTSVPACTDDNSSQVWSFDPMGAVGKKWKAMPDLNVARGYVATAVMGGTIYAIGGDVNESGTLTADPTVESWKPGDKTWNNKGVADLLEGCDESQAFAVKTSIVLAGCGQWPNALPDVQVFNKGKWSQSAPLNEARRNQAGVAISGATKAGTELMVVGGYNSDGTVILNTGEFGTGTVPGGFAARPFTAAPGSVPSGHPSLF